MTNPLEQSDLTDFIELLEIQLENRITVAQFEQLEEDDYDVDGCIGEHEYLTDTKEESELSSAMEGFVSGWPCLPCALLLVAGCCHGLVRRHTTVLFTSGLLAPSHLTPSFPRTPPHSHLSLSPPCPSGSPRTTS